VDGLALGGGIGDRATPARGPARQFLEDWKSAFEQVRYQPGEIADAGDGRFAVRLDLVATIAGTNSEVHEELWSVFVFSRGLVVRNPTFLQWSEAEAALREAAAAPSAAVES